MQPIAIDHYWKLLADSRLLSASQFAECQDDFAQLRGVGAANAVLLAEWLISEKHAITRYQADVLLKGRPGPFTYSDFLVRDVILKGRLRGCFRAVHRPTNYPVLLVFFGDDRPGDAASWSATLSTAMQNFGLDAPHLATSHEVADLGLFRFAVMDDLAGNFVSDLLQAGRLTTDKAFAVAYDVAQALVTLHATGQRHGDVRPENILVAEDGSTRLLHFPLARKNYVARPPLDAHTADYAAPELNPQVPDPTPATDVYALGCTLYQMLSGRPPFAGEPSAVPQKVTRHATEALAPLNESDAVNQIVSYMTAKDAGYRYADASTLVAALQPFIRADRPQALVPTSQARLAYQEIASRRRAAVAAAAAAAAAQATAAAMTAPSIPAPPVFASTTAGGPEIISPEGGTLPDGQRSFGLAPVNPLTGEAVTSPQAIGVGSHRAPTSWLKRQRWIVASMAVMASLLLLLAFASSGPDETEKGKAASTDGGTNNVTGGSEGGSSGGTDGDDSTPANLADDQSKKPSDDAIREDVIADDGKTLWESPTDGEPPDLRFMPTAPQVVLLLRTSELFPDGIQSQLLAAMGPSGRWFAEWVKFETSFALEEIKRLDIALYPPEAGRLQYCTITYLNEAWPIDVLLERWASPVAEQYADGTYFRRGQRAYYLPQGRTNVFTSGSVKQIHDVIDTVEEAAWLSKPIEKLRRRADGQRHVNIFFAPNFVHSNRESMYPGQLSPLHEVVSWLLDSSEDLQAGLLSAHLGPRLFLELRLFCPQHVRPEVIATKLHRRFGQASGRLSAHFFSLTVSPYSQPVLASVPGMLHAIHKYTRHDRDQPKGQQAVLRSYLPPGAALHLVAATDLALLETAGTIGGDTTTPFPEPAEDPLKKLTSLVFDRNNLESALQILSDDIGLKIEILGSDLQLEGITKNQSFGIELRDVSAEKILTEIMLRANPTKVAGPSDPELKILYVVKEKHVNGKDVIWVTTRAAAAKRGDELPPQFVNGVVQKME